LLGNRLEDMTNLICLEAFREVTRELEDAQLKHRQSVYDLAGARDKPEKHWTMPIRSSHSVRLILYSLRPHLRCMSKQPLNSPKH